MQTLRANAQMFGINIQTLQTNVQTFVADGEKREINRKSRQSDGSFDK